MSEYREHGEWALTVRAVDPATGGQWSVTAENRLGSSTRDWRLVVRRPRPEVRPEEVRSLGQAVSEGHHQCHSGVSGAECGAQ